MQAIDLSPELNCFVGQNGMGKTNILDAVYYLCMCKSSFGLRDRHIIQHERDFFRLEGHFIRQAKKEKIVAKVQTGRNKKVVERNEVPYSRLFEHIGLLPVVMIVPDDTLLISGGSEERRRFMDNTLSQLDAAYLSQLLQYNKLLKHRNAALKQMAIEGGYDEALIGAYNRQMLAPAAVIYEKRAAFIQAFVPVFQQYYARISNERELATCVYRSQLADASFEDLLEESAGKDRILQRTTKGIHKDDLIFRLDDHEVKRFASQGQLKSFLLALKLAQYEWLRQEKGIAPILLLDDIFDKLDRQRVRHLIEVLIEKNFGQVFITDTHESRLEEIVAHLSKHYRKFQVQEGKTELISEPSR